MLKKRLIGVITVKNGWAVQSIGYSRYRPLGRAEYLAENLDRWGADEILVHCIDRGDRGPDYELLSRINQMKLATPLTYGGGIRSAEDAAAVIHSGAERITLDQLLHDTPEVVKDISQLIGAQAVILSLPVVMVNGKACWFDYRDGSHRDLPDQVTTLFTDGFATEALVTDVTGEGSSGGFSEQVLTLIKDQGIPVIAFGGLTDSTAQQALLASPDIVALAVGNSLAYSEHAIQKMKNVLNSDYLRPAVYVGSTGGWR